MSESFRALRHRNYRLFWIGGVVSNTRRWFQGLALPAIIWQLTENAAWVGLAGFAQMLPMALVGPVAGVLADRHDRRQLLLVTQSLQALATLGLMLMWISGVRSPTAFVLVSAVAGLCAGMNLPAWQAFVSELVPRELLLNAITLNSMQFNSARMLGPVLAGVVLASAGPAWAFFVNFASFGGVLIALALIDTTSSISKDASDSFRPVRDFVETLQYIRRSPGIASAITIVMLVGFCGFPIQVLSVVFAEDVFETGPTGFGLMLTMIGAGAVLAGPIVAGIGDSIPRSRLQLFALVGYSSGVMSFSLAPVFPLALVSLMVVGACHLTSASLLNTTIQLQVDESRRAKVLSVYIMALTIASPLGQLTLGQLIELIGPRPVIFGAGAVMLGGGLVLVTAGRLAELDGEGSRLELDRRATPGTAPAT